jgi:hypothetical protein
MHRGGPHGVDEAELVLVAAQCPKYSIDAVTWEAVYGLGLPTRRGARTNSLQLVPLCTSVANCLI